MNTFAKRWLPPGLLALAAAIVFSPVVTSGSRLIGDSLSDSYRYMYFTTTAYRDALLRGEWPLWNPATYLGTPFLAKGNAGVLYPFTALAAVLPANVALNWLVVLHVGLAGAFMYGCARQFAFTRGAALVSGVVYMFNGFLVWTAYAAAIPMLACYAWAPAVFGAFVAATKPGPRQRLFAIGAVAALAVVILSGYPQYAFYLMAVLMSYAIWLIHRAGWRSADARAVCGVLAVVMLSATIASAALLLPMYEASRLSTRHFAEGWNVAALRLSHEGSYNPLWLVTFVFPYVFGGTPRELAPAGTDWLSALLSEVHSSTYAGYVGVLPLLLAVFAVLHYRRRRPLAGFLGGLTMLAFIMALGSYTPVYRILYWLLPVLRSFRIPARALFVVVLTLSLLAGMGLDALISAPSDQDARIRRRWSTVLLAAALATVAVAAIWFLAKGPLVDAGGRLLHHIYFDLGRAHREPYEIWLALLDKAYWVSLRGFVIAAAALACSTVLFRWCAHGPKNMKYAAMLAIAIVAADLGYYARGFARTFNVERRLADEKSILQPSLNDTDLHRVMIMPKAGFPDAVEPNVFAAIGGFNLDGYDGFVLGRYHQFASLVNRDLAGGHTRLAALANVKYVVSRDPMTLQDADVLTQGTAWVYRIRSARPRAFLAGRLRIVRDDTEALDALARSDFDPSREVVVEDEVLAEAVPEDGEPSGTARVRSLTSTSMELSVDTPRPALLVVSEMHYPGWTASIDRETTAIHRVNYTFRGVVVPRGTHDVVFNYRPASVRAGMVISAVSFAVMAGLTLWMLLSLRRR